MSDRMPDLPEAMSKADWDALGPMGRVPGSRQDKFFAQERDFDPYTGRSMDEVGDDPDKTIAVRPYHPHVQVLGPRHALGNPHRSAQTTPYEGAWGQWQHMHRTLTERGDGARQLINALASTADRLQQEGGTARRFDTAEIASNIDATRSARGNTTSSDLAEETASMNAGRFGGNGKYTVVASSTQEAEVIRKMMDWSLEVVKPSTNLVGQQLLTNNTQLPPVENMLAALEKARPQEIWGHNLTQKNSTGDEMPVRAMAVIPARGTEEELAKTATKSIPKDVLILAPDNWAFQRALRQEMGENEFNKRVWTNEAEEKGTFSTGIKLEPIKGLKGAEAARVMRENAEILVKKADRVLASWNHEPREIAWSAAAEAARRGKLAAVYVDGSVKRGVELDRLSQEAMKDNPSKAEYARGMSSHLHDVPAGSPQGRLALSLLRTTGGQDVPAPAIEAMAKTGMSINELIDMAKDQDAAKSLMRDHKIPLGAVSALRDSDAVSNAREAFGRIKDHVEAAKVQIVGPEHFPESLRNAKNQPTVLFIKGGSPEQLRDTKAVATVMGDQENVLPQMQERGAKLVQALERTGTTVLTVENMGVKAPMPEKPQILLLPNGHGHYGKQITLDWKMNEEARLQGRERIDATTENRVYSLELHEGRDQRISMTVSNPHETDPAKQSRTVDLPLRGSRPMPYYREGDDRGPKEAAAWNADIKGAMSRAVQNEAFIRSAPERTHRQAVIDVGGMVVSAMPPQEVSSLWSQTTRQREGIDSTRTPDSEARTIELAARMGDATVLVQANANTEMRRAVAVAAEKNRRIVVINPPQETLMRDEVGGNISLLSAKAVELPNQMRLPGEMGTNVRNAFVNSKVGTGTGHDMDKAAEILSSKLQDFEQDKNRMPQKRVANAR